jgi:transcription initiation factor IIE alpha subunit
MKDYLKKKWKTTSKNRKTTFKKMELQQIGDNLKTKMEKMKDNLKNEPIN